MNPPGEKEPFDIWKAVRHQLWLKITVGVLTLSATWAFTYGRDTLKAESKRMVLDTMKPGMDSLRAQVDTLTTQLEEVKTEQKRQGAVQQEFFGAMMEVMPALKRSVQERGQQNSEVLRKKAETEKLLDNLTEDSK